LFAAAAECVVVPTLEAMPPAGVYAPIDGEPARCGADLNPPEAP
jgi:hypothetical protein